MRFPLLFISAFLVSNISIAETPWVAQNSDGSLVYRQDQLGNKIPDFSHVGYHSGIVPLPTPGVVYTVEHTDADATQILQSAIDHVSKLKPNKAGQRGAILIKKGTYRISGSLHITTSGIVLRGEGFNDDGTILLATGATQRSLITVGNSRRRARSEDEEDTSQPITNSTPLAITSPYVPVGATSFDVEKTDSFHVGDTVVIHRPSTGSWIHALHMDQIPVHPGRKIVQWTAGSKDLYFSRVITQINDNHITLDAPITCALDQNYGGGFIQSKHDDTYVNEVGIESLRGDSEYKNPTDENHGWVFIELVHAENSWVSNVMALHFGYSCVQVQKQCKWITINHCACIDPISQITGGRRYSFALDGELTLVQHCYARNGRHDFVMHSLSAGPNVFYDCVAELSHADTGPHHRWSVGVLYDNVRISGVGRGTGEINIRDRGNMGTGHGWAGANQVVWNCKADGMIIENPPTAQNWVIGSITTSLRGNGNRESIGSPVLPKSLYLAQLNQRLQDTGTKH